MKNYLRPLTLLASLSAATVTAASFAVPLAPPAAASAVYTVNSTGDGADANTADGVCDDGAGRCTLRAAIQQANAVSGADTINFSIASGVQTITLSATLPIITDPVTIDATTQPGFSGTPLVVLSGGGLSTGVVGDGLVINAGGSTIRGLVINGIRGHAIKIEGGGANVVAGNYIGTDATGAARAINLQNGVFILNSNNNTVGGITAGSRNVISGNFAHGVAIAGGSTGNLVQGNYIGTDAAGNAALLNDEGGVILGNTASGNTVGGSSPAARNVISGNGTNGVATGSDTSGNFVQGNFIGTNAAGTAALANTSFGIDIRGLGNVIGGLTSSPGAPPGNLISGNRTNIFVVGSGIIIQGNLIGTDVTGTAGLAQFFSGAGITCWGPNTLIGGAEAGARNVISGNVTGIEFGNSGQATIQGNYIGTDINGAAVVANTRAGIDASAISNNIVGGTSAAARNVISGNGAGIILRGGSSTVQGNFIGTNAAGAAGVPNGDGIVLDFLARDSVIGGAADGAGNLIAFNSGNGIVVDRDSFSGAFSRNNAFRRNSIFSNGLLGIDLVAVQSSQDPSTGVFRDGVTLNDQSDPDAGPNHLQNFPILLSVTEAGGTRNVQGTLNSTPDTAFTIDFYANAACDLSGHGEGQTYVGSVAATTDAGGNAAFATALTPPPGAGSILTATATDPAGNTSEFSVCNEGSAPGSFQFISATFTAPESGAAATVTVTRTLGSAAGAVAVNYATADGTAKAGEDYAATSGTLNFAPGETAKTFTVAITDDALDELAETFHVTLSNPAGGLALGAQSTATVLVFDNDPQSVLTAEGLTVTEGNAGTSDAVFAVTLSPVSGRPVTVNYRALDFSAQSGEDFVATSGTLTFNPGETFKTVAVPIIGDTTVEPDENFTLRLSLAVGATFSNQSSSLQVPGNILDDDGAAPSIQFSASSYVASELSSSSFTIKVYRRGNVSSAASVDYATGGGTASDRSDYTPALGRLDFAPGEAEKSFAVLLTNDAFVEQPETVTLSLANASGAPLGSLTQATLTIFSDDNQQPTSANNPIDNAAFFVLQHYHDFLNRDPDAGGLQFWTSQIESCSGAGCTDFRRVSVSQAFFLSTEFQRTGYRVIRVYKASFTDGPARPRGLPRLQEFLRDTQELQRGVVVGQGDWEQRLQQNTLDYARRWVAGAEFVAQFPAAMTAEQYVDKLFQNSEVVPTSEERAAALAAYGAGDVEGRAQALLTVTGSGSVYNRQYNPAAVLMQYFGYLRRNPNDPPELNLDFGGYDFWLTKLNNHSLPGEDMRNEETARARLLRAQMVRSFLVSGEYRGRFGAP